MSEIIISDLYKSFGANDVLRGITIEINKGYVYGIVGNNGSGKSTLFKILTGELKEDSGSVFKRNGIKLGYLEQMPNIHEDIPVIDILNEAFKNIFEIEEQLKALEHEMSKNTDKNENILKKYSNLQINHESMGGHTVNERIKKVTQGLQINEQMQNSPFQTLSGGERTRVLLAKLLLSDTDILLLDEPTNHLDIDSIEWLEKFIDSYTGTVLVISHDRYFLDRSVDYIAEIENGRSEMYKGNYSFYILEKEKSISRQGALYERQQKEIKRLADRARQLHDWANDKKTHKKAEAIEKRIGRMEKVDKPRSERKIKMSVNSNEFKGKELLRAENLCFSYENGKTIFENAELTIFKGENIAILGRNGTGKTTFIKLILNEIEPDSGEIHIGPSAKYAYLPQNVIFEDSDKSILEYTQNELGLKAGEARNLLAKYNFAGEDVFKEIYVLSGGEKSRLRLCHLLHGEINLLILDEPTNHLDISSREILEDMLSAFEGVLLFISHDRYFVRKFAGNIVEVDNKKLNKYEGDYNFYREEKESKTEKPQKSPQQKNEQKGMVKKANNPWRMNRATQIEEEISQKEEIIAGINEEMFLDGISYEQIMELTARKDKITEEIEELMLLWEKYSI